MQDDIAKASRRLLPRWRALARTPSFELPVSRSGIEKPASRKNAQLVKAVAQWEKTRHLIDASEVVDAALLTGGYALAAPAALAISKDPNAVDGLNAAAKQILGHVSDRPTSELTFANERDVEKISKKIAELKWRLNAAPRNALAALEIARLQSLIGQTAPAERYAIRAIRTEPNDRYILRSIARMWAHRSLPGDSGVECALKFIWASDRVRTDPWVQAAEVSLANIVGKSPRYGVKARQDIQYRSKRGVQISELASGLATLELHSGAPLKKVRQLMKISLASPTENALAQAMSSRQSIGIEFDVERFLNLPNANEARALAAYELHDYKSSASECWKWLEDESFSVRAARMGSFINSSLLASYDQSLAFSEQGLRANPLEPMLLNSKIFSLSYLNRIEEAQVALSEFATFEHTPQIKPFVNAARGLVAFRSGDVAAGRAFYEQAIDDCHNLKSTSLAANAYIYWLDQELTAGTADVEESKSTISALDEYYGRKENAERSVVWTARRKEIFPRLQYIEKRQAAINAVESLKSKLPSFIR